MLHTNYSNDDTNYYGKIYMELPCNKTRKGNKRYTDWKRRNKITLFALSMIIYIDNSRNLHTHTHNNTQHARTHKWLQQGHRIQG